MKLQELSNRYLKEHQALDSERTKIEEKIEQREQQIVRLKKKLSKRGYGSFWGDVLVKPIAEELVKQMPGYHYELLGPFGLSSEFAIHFYKNGVSEKEQHEGDNCKSITFIPGDLQKKADLGIRNYDEDTGRYAKGTLGEINGMNHPTIELSPDMEIKDLLEYVK